LAEPRMAAILAAACGLLAGVGMAAVLLGVMCWMTIRQGWPPPRYVWPVFGIPSVSVAVLGTMFLLLWRKQFRNRMRSESSSFRWCVVLGCWAATAGCVAWFLQSALI